MRVLRPHLDRRRGSARRGPADHEVSDHGADRRQPEQHREDAHEADAAEPVEDRGPALGEGESRDQREQECDATEEQDHHALHAPAHEHRCSARP